MKVSKVFRRATALIAICSLVLACFALCGCGGADTQKAQQSRFEGCWKLSGVGQNGKAYDSSDVEKAYQNTGFIYLLSLEADGDGSFDAYNKTKHQEDITWESTGTDKVTIKFEDSVGLAEMSGDELRLEEGGMVFFFAKIDKSEYDSLLKNLGSKPKDSTNSSSDSTNSSSDSTSSSGSDGVSPEFKKQMDDYEAFFDEYVSFMKEYKSNPSDASLLSKASSIMAKYSTMYSNFNSIKNQSLSSADAAYYAEVSARILKKLSEVV